MQFRYGTWAPAYAGEGKNYSQFNMFNCRISRSTFQTNSSTGAPFRQKSPETPRRMAFYVFEATSEFRRMGGAQRYPSCLPIYRCHPERSEGSRRNQILRFVQDDMGFANGKWLTLAHKRYCGYERQTDWVRASINQSKQIRGPQTRFFINCSCSRFQSFSFSTSRLSCCFLPLARPISSLTKPPL